MSDRAVVLMRADGHALVANSLALKRAGIDRNTADPAGGSILKDAASEPTGMLIDEAMELVQKLIPPHTARDIEKALEVGAKRSEQLGWTQLQIAGNSWQEVELLCKLHGAGRIKLRIYDAIGGPGAEADRLLKQGPAESYCGDRLAVRGIKLYIDGALGSRGAALLEPYSDSPGKTGLLVNEPDALYPVLTEALKRGIQIETHAIGDRGNRIMLDLYEKAFAAVPVKDRAVAEPRWRIEHAQVISAPDIPRFAKLQVIASMQPSHAIGDLFFAPKRLGPARLPGAYAWRTLLDSAAVIAQARMHRWRKAIRGWSSTRPWHAARSMASRTAIGTRSFASRAPSAADDDSRAGLRRVSGARSRQHRSRQARGLLGVLRRFHDDSRSGNTEGERRAHGDRRRGRVSRQTSRMTPRET